MSCLRPFFHFLFFIFTLLTSLNAAPKKSPSAQPNSTTPNLGPLANLEYDQEIKGLKIPAHWFPDLQEDLFIGRATIQPAQTKIWSIGWKPTLKLENVIFQGSLNKLGSLLAKLSRASRTPISVEHLSTTDHQSGSIFLLAENGNWRQLAP